ncbi:hypothetical protein Enr10x_52730 [Gimesia panareensis]|uniref:DUF6896 domain-containing protein n=1 Tax=Gimesia panareensis TaxID=2527978 RepID=A0A517QE54_9PLAN|nr:HEAT repeat domain-containing protein [Gimesia panareensis]QDT29916.1 hypothetical protein Enr10x_52730 [Gimesia panareensis]
MLYQEILSRLDAGLKSDEREMFITECLLNPLPISPWSLWTLCSLIKHRQRQEYVLHIVRDKLSGDPKALAEAGALGHPPIERTGLVPTNTDWEYRFHGRGCCLTNRITGELLDVDFYDETADWFNSYFYEGYLESLKEPEIWERHVIKLHPSLETVAISFQNLIENGLLEKHPESSVVRLGFESDEFLGLLERFEEASDSLVQRLAAVLGDWGMLTEGEVSRQDVLEAFARTSLDREQDLIQRFERNDQQRLALRSLFEMESSRRFEILRQALSSPPSGTVSAALDILFEMNDGLWCDEVWSLLSRTDPDGELPQPHIWHTCLEYLTLHTSDCESIKQNLRKTSGHTIGDVAILALKHFPEESLGLFRRALCSTVPNNRIIAASALALIDQPWSHEELLAVLRNSDDQEMTAECRAALREIPRPKLHQIVDEWEYQNPHEAETGEWISMEEAALRRSQGLIRVEMESLHDQVLPLRAIIPPEPPSS